MTTLAIDCPGWPLFGFTEVMLEVGWTTRITGIVVAEEPSSTVATISPVYVPAASEGAAIMFAVIARGVAQQLNPATVTESQLPPLAVNQECSKSKFVPMLAI